MPAKSSRKLSGVGGLRRDEDDIKEGNLRGKEGKKVKRVSTGGKILKIKVKEVLRKHSKDSILSSSKEKTQTSIVLNGSTASPRTGQIYIGYHASSAGGVQHAITHAVSVGAKCLALFLRPQRTWIAPPLTQPSTVMFRSQLTLGLCLLFDDIYFMYIFWSDV